MNIVSPVLYLILICQTWYFRYPRIGLFVPPSFFKKLGWGKRYPDFLLLPCVRTILFCCVFWPSKIRATRQDLPFETLVWDKSFSRSSEHNNARSSLESSSNQNKHVNGIFHAIFLDISLCILKPKLCWIALRRPHSEEVLKAVRSFQGLLSKFLPISGMRLWMETN